MDLLDGSGAEGAGFGDRHTSGTTPAPGVPGHLLPSANREATAGPGGPARARTAPARTGPLPFGPVPFGTVRPDTRG
jgi:hypothetical protein